MGPTRTLLSQPRHATIGSSSLGSGCLQVFRALGGGGFLLALGLALSPPAMGIDHGAAPPAAGAGPALSNPANVSALPSTLVVPPLALPHLGWRLRGVAVGQPPLAFTPDDGTLLAQAYDVIQDDQQLVLWDLNMGQVRRVWPHTGLSGPLAVSPDGKAVARAPGNGTRLELWDCHTGYLARALSQQGGDALGLPPGASIESLAYGADGSTLLAGYAAEGSGAHTLGLSGVLELDTRTGRERRRVQFAGWSTQCIGVSKDGRVMAAAGLGPLVTVLHGGAGGAALTVHTGERRIVALGFDAAGSTLYVLASPGRLSAWNAETGAVVGSAVSLTPGRAARLDGSFSRDGRWLATEDLTLPDGVTEIGIWDLAGLAHASANGD